MQLSLRMWRGLAADFRVLDQMLGKKEKEVELLALSEMVEIVRVREEANVNGRSEGFDLEWH